MAAIARDANAFPGWKDMAGNDFHGVQDFRDAGKMLVGPCGHKQNVMDVVFYRLCRRCIGLVGLPTAGTEGKHALDYETEDEEEDEDEHDGEDPEGFSGTRLGMQLQRMDEGEDIDEAQAGQYLMPLVEALGEAKESKAETFVEKAQRLIAQKATVAGIDRSGSVDASEELIDIGGVYYKRGEALAYIAEAKDTPYEQKWMDLLEGKITSFEMKDSTLTIFQKQKPVKAAFVQVPAQTDDHVCVTVPGRTVNSRFIGTTKDERDATLFARNASYSQLCRVLFYVLSILPNQTAYQLLRGAGVVLGKVSKALLLSLARTAVPRLRDRTLRNLVLVAMVLSGTSAVADAQPAGHFSPETRNFTNFEPLRQLVFTNYTFVNLGNTTSVSLHNDSVVIVSRPFEELLQMHLEECRKLYSWEKDCSQLAQQYDAYYGYRRVYFETPLGNFHGVVTHTVDVFADSATQFLILVLRLDVALAIGWFLVFLVLVSTIAACYTGYRVTAAFLSFVRLRGWQIRGFWLLRPKPIVYAKTAVDAGITKWHSSTGDHIVWETPNGGLLRIPTAEFKKALDDSKLREQLSVSLESPKEGSVATLVHEWPVGAVQLLFVRDGVLMDNGGGVRVVIKEKDYLVTTVHQIHNQGTELWLRGPVEEPALRKTINPSDFITFDSFELVVVPTTGAWPRKVAAAKPQRPMLTSLDNIVGTFYGMVNGKLHSSTGKIGKPVKPDMVPHYATTYPGWCGYPVYVGNQWQFTHFMGVKGATSPNYCLASGSILSALASYLERKNLEDSDKWLTIDMMMDLRFVAKDRLVEFNSNEGEMRVYNPKSGKTWFLDGAQADRYKYERDHGTFEKGNYDHQSLDERYNSNGTKFDSAVAKYISQQQRENAQETDPELRKEKEEKYQDYLHQQAIRGSGTAAAELGYESAFECVCGSRDAKHACSTKKDVSAMKPEEKKKLREQAAAQVKNLPQVAEVPDEPATPLPTTVLETAKCTQTQDFRPAPDKAPGLAKSEVHKEEKKEAPVQSQARTEEKKLRKAAKNAAKKAKKQAAQESKRATARFEGPSDGKARWYSVTDGQLEELNKLAWSPWKPVSKWNQQQNKREAMTYQRDGASYQVQERSSVLPDGASLVEQQHRPKEVRWLPKRSQPVLPSDLLLSVKPESAGSQSQSSPGPVRTEPFSAGSILSTASTVSPTVQLQGRS